MSATTVERVISETFGVDNNSEEEATQINKCKTTHRRIKVLSDSDEDTINHVANVNSSRSIIFDNGRQRKKDVSTSLIPFEDEDVGSSDKPRGPKIHKKSRLRTLSSSEDDIDNMEKKPKKSERTRKRDVMVEKIMKRYKNKSRNVKTSPDDFIPVENPGSPLLSTFQSELHQEKTDELKIPTSEINEGSMAYQNNIELNINEKLSALCDNDDTDSDGGLHCSNHETDISAIKAKCTKGNTIEKVMKVQKSQSQLVKTKLREDKSQKMTAKQAMENMQKIMSDSNRMLREKEISLPYHRPKQFSLKDLLTRSKPTFAPNGKSLPLKMNQRQLEEYAKQLEERQKEMFELTKSESEDEEYINKEDDLSKKSDSSVCTEEDAVSKIKYANDNSQNISELSEPSVSHTLKLSEQSDSTFDECIKSQMKISEKYDESQSVAAERNCVVTEHVPNSTNQIQNEENVLIETRISINSDLNHVPKIDSVSSTILEASSDNGPDSQTFELRLDSENVSTVADEQISKNSTENDNNNSLNSPSETYTCNTSLEKQNDNNVCSFDQTTDINVVRNKVVTDQNSEKSAHALIESNETDTSKRTNCNSDADYYRYSDDEFPEDVDMSNIDEIMTQIENENSQTSTQPKLTGAPGTVIDLDPQRKKTGLDRLKERFCYFSQMKTVEEIEREKEKRVKPGTQHQMLKQMLEEQIAKERSREWAKRLEEEKLRSKEINTLNGDEDDELEKLEAKIEEKEGNDKCDGIKDINVGNQDEYSSEEEPEINDVRISDKKRKKSNPLIDDEAEVDKDIDELESEVYEVNYEANGENETDEINQEKCNDSDNDGDDESSESDSSTEEESSSDEADKEKPKKGRIIRAFEDSDDENCNNSVTSKNVANLSKTSDDLFASLSNRDDEITLGQKCDSIVEDVSFCEDKTVTLVASVEKAQHGVETAKKIQPSKDQVAQSSPDLFILEEGSKFVDVPVMASTQQNPSQAIGDDVLQLCSGQFQDATVNFLQQSNESNEELTNAVDPSSQRQEESFGEDILALCTGKFVDNEFVPPKIKPSEAEQAVKKLLVPTSESPSLGDDILSLCTGKFVENQFISQGQNNNASQEKTSVKQPNLNLLDDDDLEKQGSRKFFDVTTNNDAFDKTLTANFAADVSANVDTDVTSKDSVLTKKKLVIESDDEAEIENKVVSKKSKKKRIKNRALQISDDEDESEPEDMSELEENSDDEANAEEEREVEYDSEENEIEAATKVVRKKVSKFFENEAELSSEEDWVGSGDEDERGLDRMEREEGDNDVFNQGDLRKQLEKIHMRDVLDQDKREVRLLQEILLEDGDLGGGQRQRKFRWKDADGALDAGTDLGEFGESQEEEFESEEQWRRQRHERLVFLKQMTEQKKEDDTLVESFSTTEYVTASLSCTTRATVLDAASTASAKDKRTLQDVPSPVKKPFNIIQARGAACSLLSRGAGTLARLAALAEPLAGQLDQPTSLQPSKRNFVFATLSPSQHEEQPKVTIKRKSTAKAATPTMMKKLKTSEGDIKKSRLSLLDKLNT